MEHYCGNCGKPISTPNLACPACAPNLSADRGPFVAEAAALDNGRRTPLADTIAVVGLLFLLEGLLPSWADKIYSTVATLGFGQISPESAPSLVLTAASSLAAILFAVWLHDRWTQLRQVESSAIAGWLAVLLCVTPLISLGATLYFVAKIRHRFSGSQGPLLLSKIQLTTWLWWSSYHFALFSAAIHSHNESGWVATCIAFGLSCLSLVMIFADVAESTLAQSRAIEPHT